MSGNNPMGQYPLYANYANFCYGPVCKRALPDSPGLAGVDVIVCGVVIVTHSGRIGELVGGLRYGRGSDRTGRTDAPLPS